eukprot:scaffold11948_cov107-Isochrysis_galbana.AAC.1
MPSCVGLRRSVPKQNHSVFGTRIALAPAPASLYRCANGSFKKTRSRSTIRMEKPISSACGKEEKNWVCLALQACIAGSRAIVRHNAPRASVRVAGTRAEAGNRQWCGCVVQRTPPSIPTAKVGLSTYKSG